MASHKFYVAKAITHLEAAQSAADARRQREELTMALSYLKLADLAEKNGRTNLLYETPAKPVLQQQQIQPDDLQA